MIGEQELIVLRVEMRSFEDVQQVVIEYVEEWVQKLYNRFPIVKRNLDMETVRQNVFVKLYNRKSKEHLSCLEKCFIKCSKNEYGLKYIENYVKMVIKNYLIDEQRKFVRKPYEISFDYISNVVTGKYSYSSNDYINITDEELKSFMNNQVTIDDEVIYDFLLNKIPNVELPIFYKKNNRFKTMTVRRFIDLVVSGYNNKDLVGKLFKFSKGKYVPICYTTIRAYYIKTVEITQKALKDYRAE